MRLSCILMLIDSVKRLSFLQLLQWTACTWDTCCLSHSGICCSQHNVSTHRDSNYWGMVRSFGGFQRLAMTHLPWSPCSSTDLRVSKIFLQKRTDPVCFEVVRQRPWRSVTCFCLCDGLLYWWDYLLLFFSYYQSTGFVVTHVSVALFKDIKWKKQSTWRGTHSSFLSATFRPHWSLHCTSPQ